CLREAPGLDHSNESFHLAEQVHVAIVRDSCVRRNIAVRLLLLLRTTVPQHHIPIHPTRKHPVSVIEPHSLAEALQNLRQQLATQLPPDMHTRLSTAIEDLVSTKPGTGAMRVGQNAPEFTLPDLSGHAVTLSELLRAGPLVLTFYRGSWCP